MSIEFACACGKRLLARDDLAGRQGRCKACGAVYTIPHPAQEEVIAVELVDEPFPPLPQDALAPSWNSFPAAVNNPLYPAPAWQSAGFGPPQRLGQGQAQGGESGLPNWLVPAVAIAGLFVLVVVGIGMLMMSGGNSPEDQIAAANPAAVPVAPAGTARSSSPSGGGSAPAGSVSPTKTGGGSTWGAPAASAA